jgi:hypothetical protein
VCSRAEWDYLVRKVEDGVEEGPLRVRHFVSDAATRVDALIDEIAAWACPAENAEWVRDRRRPWGPEWV